MLKVKKTFNDLCDEIYTQSMSDKAAIQKIIDKLLMQIQEDKDGVLNAEQAIVYVPIVTKLYERSQKASENLVKVAEIKQRDESDIRAKDSGGFLSEAEKEELFDMIKNEKEEKTEKEPNS